MLMHISIMRAFFRSTLHRVSLKRAYSFFSLMWCDRETLSFI
nr:MAG TPA: hypothetical protein [Caudoviricetes sp.]